MSVMTAILLAAGKGERLMPLTADRPKALVEINGRTLLERAVDALNSAGIEELLAVVGYRSDAFNGLALETVKNDRYATTDNIYSLWLAKERMISGCYIVNSDVIFERRIAKLLAQTEATAILCDESVATDGESMKAVTEGGLLAQLSKQADLEDNQGEYIGLARIDPRDGQHFAGIVQGFIDRGQTGVYYEDAIEQLACETPVKVTSVAGMAWAEIDDHDDLAHASKLAEERIDIDG